jgi:chorismate-pyruvate lyase
MIPPAPNQTLQSSPQVLWQASHDEVLRSRAASQLGGAWKLLLLGDGSPTRHLELLTGLSVEVELIAMAPDPHPALEAPCQVSELVSPLLRRQVWLCCGAETLGWAESWWTLDQAHNHLQDLRQPIWRNLTAGRTELFREVDGLAQVNSPWLHDRFGHPGPYWSRNYRFFRQGRALTVIREVFSPVLERWLGPAVANGPTRKGWADQSQNAQISDGGWSEVRDDRKGNPAPGEQDLERALDSGGLDAASDPA